MAYTSPVPVTKHDLVLQRVRDEHEQMVVRWARERRERVYSPAEVCNRLRLSSATLRRWSNRYSRYLSPEANRHNNTRYQRRYTSADVHMLNLVRLMKARRMSNEAIDERLSMVKQQRERRAS